MKVGKKVRNRLFPVLLAVIMVFSMMPTAVFGLEGDAAADGTAQFSDMPDNWSTKALQNAVSNGLLGGADGKIMPNQNLTRAQMATVITRAFGATEKGDISGFADVKSADWFSDSLAKAYQMGVIKGSGSQMNPNNAITRQEVFVILARAFKLQPADKMNKAFGDTNKIAGWAKGEVAAFVNAGYIQGSNGKLNPTDLITRAEFAQIFDNIIKQYISKAGEYDQVAEGNIMINTPAVSLKNLKVTGDLIIGDGVGDGEVTLDSVTVTGRMVVRGGGENSIIIKGSSSVSNVVVARVDGTVSVKVQGDAKVEVVYIDDGSDDVSFQGTFGKIEVAAPEIVVKAVGATINNIAVVGEGAKVVVDSASKVASATLQAPNIQISGTGTVTKVEAQTGSTGSKIETPNTQISVGAGVSGITGGGGAKVEPGTNMANSPDGKSVIGPTAALPSSGGGGGGGGNPTPPTLTVSNVTINSATSVTFSSIAAPSAVSWNGNAISTSSITYNAADKIATVTVPKITSITNTLAVSAAGYTSATASASVTLSAGNLILIGTVGELTAAVSTQADGQSWLIKNGTYNMGRFDSITAGTQTGWYFPITASDISITGESKGGVVLTSDTQSPNGAWASQDHVSVWGDRVAIQNLTIKPKITTNKTVEVMGKDFTICNVDFVQRDDATYQFAGSLYFNPQNNAKNIGSVSVENVLINDAWISCSPKNVSMGALNLKNVTIDFRGSAYANYPDYGVFSKNDAVATQVAAGSYFKVLADSAPNLQTPILDRVPAGTTVVLAAGTYYMTANPVVPAGVTLDKETNGAVIEILGANTVIVRNDSEFNAALSGTAQTIRMAPGTYEFSSQIRITRPVTIIGAGDSTIITKGDSAWVNATGSKGYAPLITINSGNNAVRLENIKVTGAKNIAMTGPGDGKTDYGSGINVVSSSDVILKNVTSAANEAAGLIVNSSSVSAINLNTKDNSWYGVNVDQAAGGNASFALSGNGVLAEPIQIISDKTDGATVTADGYKDYKMEGTTKTKWHKGEVRNIISVTTGEATKYYDSVKAAVSAAISGSSIVVLAKGTYDITGEPLAISKNITVAGIDMDETILKGTAGIGGTVSLNGGATLRNLTVTRDNSVWLDADNKNVSLVSFGQGLNADTTLESCIMTKGRNGVYLNNAANSGYKAIIRNNIIDDNRTGINLTGNCNGTVIIGNEITDNWTIGVVYYNGGTSGTNLSTITLQNNKITGNWYGQLLLKTPGVLDAPSNLTTGLLKIESNDFGGASSGGNQTVTLATKYSASHAEPANDQHKPAHITEGTPAGTATAPTSWTPPMVRIYKQPLAGVTGAGITFAAYTDGDEGTVNVSTEAQLKSALTDASFTTINLTADISVTAMIKVDRVITIDGKGHVITVASDLGTNNASKHAMDIYADNVSIRNVTIDNDSKAYGVQAYEATGVSLDGVTIKDSKGAALTVNGATVTANDLNTSGNAWGGVNVDPGSGVTEPSIFNLTGNGTLAETIQIWADPDNTIGTDPDDLTGITVFVSAVGYTPNSTPAGHYWTNITLPTEISAADIKGLIAPVTDATPITYAAFSTSDGTYTITGLTWSPSVPDDPGTFAGVTTYSATIVLTAEDGYKFPPGFTPTVNAGTADPGTTSDDAEGNQLTFIVRFDPTL